MRRPFVLGVIWGVLVATSLWCGAARGGDASTPPGAPPAEAVPASQPSSGDPGADLVASFYHVLLEEQPPTIEQERALFPTQSALRAQLVLGMGGGNEPDVEPMRRTPEQIERRRALQQKVATAGPVVLECFRRHKDWFTVGARSGKNIQISSLARFVRTVDDIKDLPTQLQGFVIALAFDGHGGLHTIALRITNGKVDADDIHLGGFDGNLADDTVLGEMKQAGAAPAH